MTTINHEEETKLLKILMSALEEQLPQKGIILISSEQQESNVDAKIVTNIDDQKFIVTLLLNLLEETGGMDFLRREIARYGKN